MHTTTFCVEHRFDVGDIISVDNQYKTSYVEVVGIVIDSGGCYKLSDGTMRLVSRIDVVAEYAPEDVEVERLSLIPEFRAGSFPPPTGNPLRAISLDKGYSYIDLPEDPTK